jgi:hypothetical protein
METFRLFSFRHSGFWLRHPGEGRDPVFSRAMRTVKQEAGFRPSPE